MSRSQYWQRESLVSVRQDPEWLPATRRPGINLCLRIKYAAANVQAETVTNEDSNQPKKDKFEV